MFEVLVKFVYNKLFDTSPSEDWYIQQYQSIVDEIDTLGRDDKDAQNANIHVEESFMPNAEFFRYNGIASTHPHANCTAIYLWKII